MNSNIYTNIEAHILRSNMNSIHKRHVSSQERPRRMNHTFQKITRWRNSRKNKIKSRSCHHIALIKIFPMSQEFCNSDSVWESYANFIEDAQKFLCKNELLLCCCKKNLRLISTNSLIYIHHWLFLDVFIYTLKWTCFMLANLSSKVRVVRSLILIKNCNLTFSCHTNFLPLQW